MPSAWAAARQASTASRGGQQAQHGASGWARAPCCGRLGGIRTPGLRFIRRPPLLRFTGPMAFSHNGPMPELPEVEVTRARHRRSPARARGCGRCGWASPCAGRWACRSRHAARPPSAPAARRGKYLWLPLAGPAPAADPDARRGCCCTWACRARCTCCRLPPARGPHDHFDLHTDRGTLRLTDPRRFGAVVWSAVAGGRPGRQAAGAGWAPSPSTRADAGTFHAALQRRRRTADQGGAAGRRRVVGAGNIYACEALFRAGIDPRAALRRASAGRARRAAAGGTAATLARALRPGRLDAARLP
jgi:formamidopyrimidine-DNA glycosylase